MIPGNVDIHAWRDRHGKWNAHVEWGINKSKYFQYEASSLFSLLYRLAHHISEAINA